MNRPNSIPSNPSKFLLYQTEDSRTRIETRLLNESAGLMLNPIAELFQRDKAVTSRHIRNIFEEGELLRDRVVAEYAAGTAAPPRRP